MARQLLKDFIINWKLFLGIHIAVNAFSLLVLTPLFTLVLGWLVLASGQTALTDVDILQFALTPAGLPVMLLAAAFYTTIVIFQQAAMITAGHFASVGQTLSMARLGHHLLMRFWPLFRLAIQMTGRTGLIAAPFLVLGVFIYSVYLTEFDINYYLADKPPVFWWAGGFILLCLLTMTGVLLRVFSGWVLALPLLLIDGKSPARVLQMSRKASASMRISIAVTLLSLFLLHSGVLAVVSVLTDLGIDGATALAGDSLQKMAYLVGGLLVIWLLASVAVAFFGNSILSLLVLSWFARFTGTITGTTHRPRPGARPAPARAPGRWYVSATRLAVMTLLISLTAGLAISSLMNRLDFEQRTMVIAHRGASADAPENTLAAIELAISEGADQVEIDVQETREGGVVVIHDSDLKRIGDSGLKVAEASLFELQSVDIGSWKDPSFSDQRVPTLQQVLALCKDRIHIVIELKYYGHEQQLEKRVAGLVEAAGMQDQIVLMSLSYPGIRKMKSIRPDWKVGLLSSVALGDITLLEADFFAINAKSANRAFIRLAHKRNREVLVWTVNDPVDLSAMISKGVDGIITDKPGLASKIRTERSGLELHERMLIQLAGYFGKQPDRPEQ